MFKLLKKLFKRRNIYSEDRHPGNLDISKLEYRAGRERLVADLDANLKKLQQYCGPSFDVVVRRFRAGGRVPAALIRLDGLTDSKTVEEILRTLMVDSRLIKEPLQAGRAALSALEELLTAPEVSEVEDMAAMFHGMAAGSVALLFNGSAKVLLCDAKGFNTRSVVEPNAELTIRGPREGFIESLRTNTSMIRRRIRIPHLWFEHLVIGDLTRTEVAFAYIKGLAAEKLVREVRERLRRVKADSILESGYLEDFIEDTSLTLFPLTYRTERPDKVCAALLEGRVAIFTNGTPHVLIVPAELPMLMQAPDDYYEPPPIGSLIRFLRYISLVLAMLLPAFYVSVINFHQELLPTALLLRITATREGVPFPVIFEVLLMDTLFEILREAGVRLPAAIGPAISIVGALILGDAAIRAGLVSPAVVIVIALTAIASFTTPVFSLGISFRILRFVYTILGAVFGLFGVQFALLITAVHLCSLRSFGSPYLSPLAPLTWQDMKDNLIRTWWWGMQTRPKLLGQREPQRIPPGQQPVPGRDPGEPAEREGEE